MEEHPVLVLFDLGGDFEAREDACRGLRLGQGSMLQGVCTQGMMEDIGGTSQEEPHRVGQEAGGRRAVAVEVIFHRLNVIFAIAPCAIEVFVEHLGGRRLKRRHHKAGVLARTHDFGLAHDPPWLRPGPGGLDELVIEPTTGRRRLVLSPGQRNPLVMETPRLLDGGSGLAEQDGIASEAKDQVSPTSMRDHCDHLWRGKMTIAPHQDVRVRPVASQIRQQPHQDHGIFGPGRAGARTPIGGDQGMRGPFKNKERQIAMVLRGIIIAGKLLLPIRRIIGVGHIEDHGGGRLGIAGDAVVHQGTRQTIDVFAVHLVLQPGERGGTR